MNETAVTYGPSFGLGVLIPVSLVLLVPLIIGVRRAGSMPAKFVIVALFLRYLAGAYHLYMFKPFFGGFSGNALLSIGLTLFGLAFVVKPANFAIKWVLPIYLMAGLVMISSMVNHDVVGGINVAVKYAYLLVMAVSVFQAMRLDPQGRWIGWAITAFLPLLVFQVLSLALNLPKGSEDGSGLVWIGGYNHEAAFSIALATGFVMICFARAMHPAIRAFFLLWILVGIQFAGYRTTILAMAPIMLATFLASMTLSVRRDQRKLMATAAVVGGVVIVCIAGVLYADKFQDLATFLANPGSLIKDPRTFDYADRQIMSARALIWSSYIFAWLDGTPAQHVFGFGAESWEGLFKVYPHNTLIATLYELGVIGVIGMLTLWTTMFSAALKARTERFQLIAAHFSFFLLNMATMPFWQVEGLGLYGFLCGYTIYCTRVGLRSSGQARGIPPLGLNAPAATQIGPPALSRT